MADFAPSLNFSLDESFFIPLLGHMTHWTCLRTNLNLLLNGYKSLWAAVNYVSLDSPTSVRLWRPLLMSVVLHEAAFMKFSHAQVWSKTHCWNTDKCDYCDTWVCCTVLIEREASTTMTKLKLRTSASGPVVIANVLLAVNDAWMQDSIVTVHSKWMII